MCATVVRRLMKMHRTEFTEVLELLIKRLRRTWHSEGREVSVVGRAGPLKGGIYSVSAQVTTENSSKTNDRDSVPEPDEHRG